MSNHPSEMDTPSAFASESGQTEGVSRKESALVGSTPRFTPRSDVDACLSPRLLDDKKFIRKRSWSLPEDKLLDKVRRFFKEEEQRKENSKTPETEPLGGRRTKAFDLPRDEFRRRSTAGSGFDLEDDRMDPLDDDDDDGAPLPSKYPGDEEGLEVVTAAMAYRRRRLEVSLLLEKRLSPSRGLVAAAAPPRTAPLRGRRLSADGATAEGLRGRRRRGRRLRGRRLSADGASAEGLRGRGAAADGAPPRTAPPREALAGTRWTTRPRASCPKNRTRTRRPTKPTSAGPGRCPRRPRCAGRARSLGSSSTWF